MRPRTKSRLQVLITVVTVLGLIGCTNFTPMSPPITHHREIALTKEDQGLRVSTAILDDDTAEAVYGVDLGLLGMRAIWLEIHNNSGQLWHLLPTSIDENYFTEHEAAYPYFSSFTQEQNAEILKHFQTLSIARDIPPGDTVSGYVIVNRHRGGRFLAVEVTSDESLARFEYLFQLPDGSFDYEEIDFNEIYRADEIKHLSIEDLWQALAAEPCCTRDASGEHDGDPLNIAFIGTDEELLGALARTGWEFTESVALRAVVESIRSTLLGTPEFNYPISPLYWRERDQDIALQRPRGTIPQRNHMRLWLTPWQVDEKSVWVGQISRDVGIKATWHAPFFVTHVIDPHVDKDRHYLLELLMRAQVVDQYGYVDGVGEATREAPRLNLAADQWWSDGQRLIIDLAEEPTPLHQIRHFGPDQDQPAPDQ